MKILPICQQTNAAKLGIEKVGSEETLGKSGHTGLGARRVEKGGGKPLLWGSEVRKIFHKKGRQSTGFVVGHKWETHH